MQQAIPNESDAMDAPNSQVAGENSIGTDAHSAENG